MRIPINLRQAGVILGALLVVGLLTGQLAMPQNNDQAELLFQSAMNKELVSGELEQAIDIYKKIVASYSNNRPVAAKALLQIGKCDEKLGKDEARKAYERLVRDYADQNEVAAEARARLAALRKPASASKEMAFATRQVWTTPDMGNIEGAPSPDGRFLSFTDWETGDLAIRDLETGTNRRLTNKGPWEKSEEFAMFSRWSPDGKQIAYDWYDGKCCTDLHVIAREGGTPRTLIDNKNDEWMQTYDWSPDGKQILIFLEKKDGTRQIVLVSAMDGATKVVKTFERSGRLPQVMRFSRDKHYIAYDQPQEENAAEHDIFLISADGSNEVPLVKHPADDRLLGWPPDGEGILFASDRTGSLDLWFLPVSAGKAQGVPQLIRRGVEEIVPLGFTQNGSFYYAQGQWMLDVYVAKMGRESGKILAPPEKAIMRFEGANSWPEYSPDGKYLAYLTTRSRAFQAAVHPNIVCIRSLETGKEREFSTKFKRLAGPRWSPDGQFVYLATWDYPGMGIYRLNAQTGEFTPIVRTESPAWLQAHEVSPDENIFIYERRDKPKDPFRILSRDLTTGEEKQLYAGDPESGSLSISLSPDGRWLAFINMDKKKILQVMPVSGGEPKELLRFEENRSFFGWIEWTADGKYILFPRVNPAKDNPGFALWRIAADGGEPQELNLVMPNFENLSVHPDGEHLALSSPGFTLKSPAVWVMENFLPPAGSSK
ncbi:MAG: tetratricopeptide repeat protein [Acidobacteriia bacterium]|nr:tetratricopeptide repeat protein [Terriglobia bacterium]